MLHSLRLAIRQLSKTPGYTVAVIVILALGIGANTAIFSLIDAVMFRPLPLREPETLVRIFATDEQGQHDSSSSYPVYRDYVEQATTFSGVAAYSESAFHLAVGEDRPVRIRGMLVSGNYFDVLGIRPAAGRLLNEKDDRVHGGHPVAVVSYRLWQRRFDQSREAIGKTIRINGFPFTIVGVATRQFTGADLESFPDVWVTMAMEAQAVPNWASEKVLEERRISWLDLVGRLREGVTIDQANAQLQAIAVRRAAINREEPYARARWAAASSMNPEQREAVSRVSWLLLSVTLLVLLIACADAAGLMLVRGERRQRDLAIRLAVGATRWHIFRQLMIESLALALAGAALGILFAIWTADLLVASLPAEFPLPAGAGSIDSRVLAFTMGAAILSGLVFGVLPSLRASRVNLVAALKRQQSALTRFWRVLTLRNGFTVVQIALSVILLFAALLLLRSLRNISAVDPLFHPEHRLVASFDLAREGYGTEEGKALAQRLLEEVRSVPGVRTAALARVVPVQRSGMRVSFEVSGYNAPPNSPPLNADFNPITPGFFRTMGIAMLAGRDFTEADRQGSPEVIIVNEKLAKRFWPTENPMGKVLPEVGFGKSVTIVGVVANARYRSLREEPGMMIYTPLAQRWLPSVSLVIDTAVPARSLVEPVTNAVARIDPDMPLYDMQTLEEKLRLALSQERLMAVLLIIFAALALVLSTFGLYAVVSYSTQARRQEFGIRKALGALPGDVFELVLRQSGVLLLLGLAFGLPAAIFLSRLGVTFLYGVTPADPLSALVVIVVLGVAAMAATQIPARSAVRVEPMTVLRYE